MDGISQDSGGPLPDKLSLKVGGTLPTELDMKRTQVVRIELEAVVVGHTFTDQFDKDGDRSGTHKIAVLKVDELVSIEPIVRAHRSHVPGQTAMEVDGEAVPNAHEHDGEFVGEAEVVGELPIGEVPGVDPHSGEVTDQAAYDEHLASAEPPATPPEPPAAEDPDADLAWR